VSQRTEPESGSKGEESGVEVLGNSVPCKEEQGKEERKEGEPELYDCSVDDEEESETYAIEGVEPGERPIRPHSGMFGEECEEEEKCTCQCGDREEYGVKNRARLAAEPCSQAYQEGEGEKRPASGHGVEQRSSMGW
jgi:hypothetical protein